MFSAPNACREALPDYDSVEGNEGRFEIRGSYLGGCYELNESAQGVKESLYLSGGYYDAPAVCIKSGSVSQVFYILRDYLGSVIQVVTANGSLVQELSYDAWGRLRDPDTHDIYKPGKEPELFLGRGYTGHEHLTQFGLINMNARLYDPALGRFLSPDPYVQMPDMPQNFNRYSYTIGMLVNQSKTT